MKNRNINSINQLTELLQKKALIVDLRDEKEFENDNIDGSINIPAIDFRNSINDLNRFEKPIIFCADNGVNSQKVYDSFADQELDFYNGGSVDELKKLIHRVKSHESYGQRNIGDYFR